ncbi:hypothetical protein [Clostridium formicaceticum]|uniref:Uncharacterized protein n=1 Tax=Clostridium formicaceticum TaxID=1497 RepID=A0AAC9WG98_9CLOT|nr:hypothetical protein [Clostridium formicaceticum]AOY77231.1 hypothetical protein BJL90_16065 [Clostridium formicaceticum]ARE87762.1 hypothetical protein CLFO_21620 [Clostridium formicaceticum]
MGAKNKVIAGEYKGKSLAAALGTVIISTTFTKSLVLDNTTVDAVEVVTDEHRKSAASGVARGLVGGALLGPVGMLAGGLSAKSKGIYTLAIRFKDGKESLVEVDDKIYKALLQKCF